MKTRPLARSMMMVALSSFLVIATACGGSDDDDSGSGAAAGTSGSSGSSGAAGSGGTSGSAGSSGSAGAGGSSGAAGSGATGGTAGSGGSAGSGGTAGASGSAGSAGSGAAGAGGTAGSSGSSGTSGSAGTAGTAGASGSSGAAGNGGDPEPAGMDGMTAAHNAARANVTPAANPAIPPLAWNATVAATAQAWADLCVFQHSSNSYGENLYASAGSVNTPQDVVDSWVSEVVDYDYANNVCNGTCGHYTQVVWRDSVHLGCGHTTCTQNSPFSGFPTWDLWVCNYDPPGNFNNQRPY